MSGKKALLITLEVIALAILTVGAYWGTVELIIAFSYSLLLPYIFPISVIVLDIMYICTIKFWPLKNIHIKIVAGLLLLAFSAAAVTFFIIAMMFVMPS